MDRKIHVSVIVPAHNEEKYVKRCIDSIRAMTVGGKLTVQWRGTDVFYESDMCGKKSAK